MGKIVSLLDSEKTSIGIKSMELIQLSTEWCAPCKMARAWINNTFDVDRINYQFVNVQKDNGERINSLVRMLNPRSVPMFVIVENENTIVETFNGVNKAKITQYANAVESMLKTEEVSEEAEIIEDEAHNEEE